MTNHELNTNFESQSNFDNLESFLNPTKGEYCLIPAGFGVNTPLSEITIDSDIRCPLFKCMIKDGYPVFTSKSLINKKTFELYEKYLLFTSILYKRHNAAKKHIYDTDDKEPGFPLIVLNFSSSAKNNLQSLMAGMNRTLVSKMIGFFEKYEFIHLYEPHDFLTKKGESSDTKITKAAQYLVCEKFDRAIKKYHFQTKRIVINLKHKNISKIKDLEGDSVIDFEKYLLNDATLRSFTFPSTLEVFTKAKELVNSKVQDKHGRTYVWKIPDEWMHEDNGKVIRTTNSKGLKYSFKIRGKLKPNCPFVDINSHINNYLLSINGIKYIKPRKKYESEGKTYYDRFYYDLSLMTSWIRSLIKIDGESIVQFDATALHPRIVGLLYSNKMDKEIPDFLKGDAHTKISNLLGITRQEAKIINLTYWNSRITHSNKTVASKNNDINFKKLDKYIQNNFPDLWDFLIDVKIRMNCIKGNNKIHSNMSALLVDQEVRLMQKIIYTVSKISSTIYCYDCIYIKESVKDIVELIFIREINNHLTSYYEISEVFGFAA